MSFCSKCGNEVTEGNAFCPNCGNPLQEIQPLKPTCPMCQSTNITFNVFQEDLGDTTVSFSKSKYKEKGHGCLWWLLIGWWWWIIDLILWICIFPVRLVLQLFKKKKYDGKAATVTQSAKRIVYKTMCTCGNCGHSWVKEDSTIENKPNIKQMKKEVKRAARL